jgi:XTP/dITP diphosphohydrolase
MPSPDLLVLGTGNRKKAVELVELLAPLGLTLKTLADFPNALTVEETGDSFRANATLKAVEQARHLHAWVLGEDSGLAVDALEGAPGIFSARYAGPKATDEQNNARLLEQMADVPEPRRTAHYVCHLVLADASGVVRAESAGTCQGRIRRQPAGSAGFGYDPLFEIPEYHRTFGELGEQVKAVLSHRSRAIERLLPQLIALHEQSAFATSGI